MCFKCGKEKPLKDFYKHPRSADGHLNKCKTCTKSDVKKNYRKKLGNPDFVEKERKRGREKHHRLYSGMATANMERAQKWISKYPEKRAANLAAKNLKVDGKENHHWSYMENHWLDIIFLTKQHHMKAHRFIVYDQERRMYRRFDTNELLDTKAKHRDFINWCIQNKDD